MASGIRLTQEEFDNRVKDLLPNITFSCEYINQNTRVDCKCNICGYEFNMSARSLLLGHGCKKCYYKKRGESDRLTNDVFLERMSKINPNIKVLSEYTRRKDKTKCLCLTCNNEWETSFDKLLEGRSCPVCAIKNRPQNQPYSNDEFLKRFKELGNKNVILLDEYTNSSTKMHCKCKVCGHEWYTVPQVLLDGHACSKCGNESNKIAQRKTHEQFIDEFNEIGNPNIEIISTYISCSFPITVRCKECGKTWDADPVHILYSGNGCRDCYVKNCRGVNNPNWNFDLTEEERKSGRRYLEYYDFIKDVLKRDNYTCQITGQIGTLNVHHIYGYSDHKELRTDINNGITLSEDIHKEYHKKYGYKDVTKEKFLLFLKDLYEEKRLTSEKYNSLLERLK